MSDKIALKPGQVPCLIMEPIGDAQAEIKERLSKDPLYRPITIANINEMISTLRNLGGGLVLMHAQSKDDVINHQSFLKLMNPMIKRNTVKVIVTSPIVHPAVIATYQKLGVLDVVPPTIGARAIEFKVRRYLELLGKTVFKVSAQSIERKAAPVKQEAPKEAKKVGSDEVRLVDSLLFQSEIFLIKGGTAKKVMGRWMVRLQGPSTAVGKWTEARVRGERESCWKWVPSDGTKFIVDPGEWIFRGHKPELQGNIWNFVGKSPKLWFFDPNEPDQIKIKVDVEEDGALKIAKDGPFGLQLLPRIQATHEMKYKEGADKIDGKAQDVEDQNEREAPSEAEIEGESSVEPEAGTLIEGETAEVSEWGALSSSDNEEKPKDWNNKVGEDQEAPEWKNKLTREKEEAQEWNNQISEDEKPKDWKRHEAEGSEEKKKDRHRVDSDEPVAPEWNTKLKSDAKKKPEWNNEVTEEAQRERKTGNKIGESEDAPDWNALENEEKESSQVEAREATEPKEPIGKRKDERQNTPASKAQGKGKQLTEDGRVQKGLRGVDEYRYPILTFGAPGGAWQQVVSAGSGKRWYVFLPVHYLEGDIQDITQELSTYYAYCGPKSPRMDEATTEWVFVAERPQEYDQFANLPVPIQLYLKTLEGPQAERVRQAQQGESEKAERKEREPKSEDGPAEFGAAVEAKVAEKLDLDDEAKGALREIREKAELRAPTADSKEAVEKERAERRRKGHEAIRASQAPGPGLDPLALAFIYSELITIPDETEIATVIRRYLEYLISSLAADSMELWWIRNDGSWQCLGGAASTLSAPSDGPSVGSGRYQDLAKKIKMAVHLLAPRTGLISIPGLSGAKGAVGGPGTGVLVIQGEHLEKLNPKYLTDVSSYLCGIIETQNHNTFADTPTGAGIANRAA